MPNRLGNNCTVAIKRCGMLSVPINRKVWLAFKKSPTLDMMNKSRGDLAYTLVDVDQRNPLSGKRHGFAHVGSENAVDDKTG